MASGVSGLSVRTLPGLTADPFEGRGDVCFAHHSILTWPQVCMEASKSEWLWAWVIGEVCVCA
jgi:hypothetical protein